MNRFLKDPKDAKEKPGEFPASDVDLSLPQLIVAL